MKRITLRHGALVTLTLVTCLATNSISAATDVTCPGTITCTSTTADGCPVAIGVKTSNEYTHSYASGTYKLYEAQYNKDPNFGRGGACLYKGIGKINHAFIGYKSSKLQADTNASGNKWVQDPMIGYTCGNTGESTLDPLLCPFKQIS